MKSWEPEEEFERADFPRTAGGPRKKVTEWKPPSVGAERPAKKESGSVEKPISQKQVSTPMPAEAATSAQGAALFIPAAILTNPEGAAAVIRHYFWQKGGSPTGAQKIRILLSRCGGKALKSLGQILTPVERTQFAEILKSEADGDAATVESVCAEFLRTMRSK